MRMIDRWFPCAAVSEASHQPYGSGRTEKALFTWFAARPIAQARAAALTTLLEWPEDEGEQKRLKNLVERAIRGDSVILQNIAAEVRKAYPEGVRILDPFSGRAMIPLEASRAGADAWGIDYSPVATLGGLLLADYPSRDWCQEPRLNIGVSDDSLPEDLDVVDDKFVRDLETILNEVGQRFEDNMNEFYPLNANDERPWGYLWAQMMPCDECKNQFPLVGSTALRPASSSNGDPGQCFSFVADRETGSVTVLLHEGTSNGTPTLFSSGGGRKVARCPFCGNPHDRDVIKARAQAHLLHDKLLLVADRVADIGPVFRLPSADDVAAVERAQQVLKDEAPFRHGVPAIPDERIPAGNTDTVRASLYGAEKYGDLCCDRQTLGFVRLCRIISNLRGELATKEASDDYVRALLGYAGSCVVRKLRYSTRGATLRASNKQVHDVFKNQASINQSFDFFEAGIGTGAGTWRSLMSDTISVVKKLRQSVRGTPARIRQGSALRLPFKKQSIDVVITDPPYYNMIDYSDASDLFFVWLKRALGEVFPELFDQAGVQDKSEEIIVKRGAAIGDHRTSAFYKESLKKTFDNVRSVLKDDGALTLVFGHGDPEAWRLLLTALSEADFVVTGSWPARTEEAAGAGSANIVVTITIACRPAAVSRPNGLQGEVDLAVEREIRARVADWERDELALTDQLMAAYGPAMEVVGRYSTVIRPDGTSVDIDHYLALARRTVQDAASIKIDGLPLETFDTRSRFALFWTRLYGRQLAPKSEAVFQAMASNLRLDDVRRNMLEENQKGYRLASFGECPTDAVCGDITSVSAVIDIVRQMVRAWRAVGGEGVASVLTASERDPDDGAIWAIIVYLAGALPLSDTDRKALEDILRNRRAIGTARATLEREHVARTVTQGQLFESEVTVGSATR